MTNAVVCAAGKLPIHGDFIRLATAPEIAELDAWLLAGIERAYERRGRAFEQDLQTFAPLRFVYTSPRSRRVLHGVLLPSSDQVGRTYPFVAAFCTPPIGAGPEFDRLPLTGEASIAQLLAAVQGSAGQSLPELLRSLQAVAWSADEGQAERSVRAFLLGTTLDALLLDLPGFHNPDRRVQLLHELWQATQGPWPPRYVATVPLRARADEVTFWLALLRQWVPLRVNPTLVAWPVAGGTGLVRWLYDDLHGRYFESLLWPEAPDALALHLGRNTIPPRGQNADGIDVARLLRPRALLQDVVLAAGRA